MPVEIKKWQFYIKSITFQPANKTPVLTPDQENRTGSDLPEVKTQPCVQHVPIFSCFYCRVIIQETRLTITVKAQTADLASVLS
ncbi:hypothetical protein SAMN05216326_10639 [Nitrosomonas marina]|uniref:Uncharacterized protein n=1 Tax=Nitrosomonas marina TaxID=917 RepID=A0A1I0A4N3_9PROT|nr:hypothetical protein SAMN05216326_10639 [Nitrosomonas marina]